MVRARIDSQRTSQSVSGLGGTTIYSREPNRKNAVFVGNLTWVSSIVDSRIPLKWGTSFNQDIMHCPSYIEKCTKLPLK